MERTAFEEKFRELLRAADPLNDIETLYNKAVECGAIYIAGEAEDSYRLCKIVYYAILCEMCEKWKPSDKQHRKEAYNLRLFL